MATNPYVNKVVYGNQTVMDISDTTAEEADVISGKTFYKADGAKGVGSAVIPSTDDCYKTTDDEAYAIGDDDYFPYYSDSLSEKVKISWYNFKARLKAYFDTIYAQFAGTETELRDTVGWTSKNLYPLTLDSLKALNTSGTWSGNVYTLNSVTFTVSTNADGYVTAVATSGTASNQTSFYFIRSTVGGISDYLPYGNYIMNGCANGGSLMGFHMDFDIGTTMNRATDSSDKSFSIPSDSSLLVLWDIEIPSGQSMAYKTFYPMIRKATIGSNTFEPYHPSVEQTLRDAEVIDGKNLLDPTILNNGNDLVYVPIKVGEGQFTLSTDAPRNSAEGANIFLLAGNVSTGASTGTNGAWQGNPITQTSVNGYVSIASRGVSGVDITQYNNMLEKGTTATTFQPYYIPLKDSKFDRAEQRVLGAKNLLAYPYYDTTKSIFTDNNNGTITVNGTVSERVVFNLVNRQNPHDVPSGKYKISKGFKSGDIGLDSGIVVEAYNNNTWVKVLASCAGNDNAEFDIDYNGYNHINVYLYITSGTYNNLLVKPMLRLVSDPDDTYVPYAMTNKELTDAISSGLGHTMIPDPAGTPTPTEATVANAIIGAISEGGENDDVVSAYGVGVWSNTDTITLMTTVSQGDTEMGTWEADDTWETSGVRTGWLQHAALHGILSAADKNDYEISLVFDVAGGEAISCLAYRIDDAITSSLGGIAIKFNAPIKSVTASVGVVIKHNRTKTFTVTRT